MRLKWMGLTLLTLSLWTLDFRVSATPNAYRHTSTHLSRESCEAEADREYFQLFPLASVGLRWNRGTDYSDANRSQGWSMGGLGVSLSTIQVVMARCYRGVEASLSLPRAWASGLTVTIERDRPTPAPWLLSWQFYLVSVVVIAIGLLAVLLITSAPALPDRYCKHDILGDECEHCAPFGRRAG